MKVCKGLALEGRNLEEGEVLLPSPHRCLQRVLSLLNGTKGQKAKYLYTLSAAVQIPDISLDHLPHLVLFLIDSSCFPLLLPFCMSLLLILCLYVP